MNENFTKKSVALSQFFKMLAATLALLFFFNSNAYTQCWSQTGQAGVFDIEVTTTGNFLIEAVGADGASDEGFNGGSGGLVRKSVNLDAGDFIRVIIGGAGSPCTSGSCGGGGGGTAVFDCGTSIANCDGGAGALLLIAGGGGGAGDGIIGQGAQALVGDGTGGQNQADGGGGGGGLNSAGQGGSSNGGGQGSQAACSAAGPNGGKGFGGGGGAHQITAIDSGGGGGGHEGGDGGNGDGGGAADSFGRGGHNFVNFGVNVAGVDGGGSGANGSASITQQTTGNCSLVTATDCDGLVLPVELVDFNAFEKENQVYLDWHTGMEFNNEGFEIERSDDGRNWVLMGFVAGTGTTQVEQHYYYIDEKPRIGLSYYRLKQIDFDGGFAYSNIKTVQVGRSGDSGISIFPNPIGKDELNVVLSKDFVENGSTLRLFSLTGQLLRTEAIISNANTFSLDGLNAGIYLIEVTDGREIWQEKLIVR